MTEIIINAAEEVFDKLIEYTAQKDVANAMALYDDWELFKFIDDEGNVLKYPHLVELYTGLFNRLEDRLMPASACFTGRRLYGTGRLGDGFSGVPQAAAGEPFLQRSYLSQDIVDVNTLPHPGGLQIIQLQQDPGGKGPFHPLLGPGQDVQHVEHLVH